MGLLSKTKASKDMPGKNAFQRSLPPDKSSIKCGPDACHCVSERELERRYDILRQEEHARIDMSCGPKWTRHAAQAPENASKNRYSNILPWDHSRVILPVPEGQSDYINASWIQLGNRTYIAAQGPMPSTIGDFWHMTYVYGGEPAVVLMLTPLHEQGVEKCAKYWPSKGETMDVETAIGSIAITCDKYSGNDHYNYAVLRLTPADSNYPERLVHHFYYYSWLDYTRPNADADLRGLIFLINNTIRNPGSPLVVHCSAGIGRTGTFIAIDALMVKVDNELQSTIAPNVCPVWRDQFVLQYRPNPFTEDPTFPDGRYMSCGEDTEQAIEDDDDYPNGGAVEEPPCAASPPKQASALTGPAFTKKKTIKSDVDPKWARVTPDNMNVFEAFNEAEDVVMGVLRYMRMQRPKMVQGAQQLGYIYDQLEIAEQLVRGSHRTERVIRRATVDMGETYSIKERSNSVASSQKSSKSASKILRVPTFHFHSKR